MHVRVNCTHSATFSHTNTWFVQHIFMCTCMHNAPVHTITVCAHWARTLPHSVCGAQETIDLWLAKGRLGAGLEPVTGKHLRCLPIGTTKIMWCEEMFLPRVIGELFTQIWKELFSPKNWVQLLVGYLHKKNKFGKSIWDIGIKITQWEELFLPKNNLVTAELFTQVW